MKRLTVCRTPVAIFAYLGLAIFITLGGGSTERTHAQSKPNWTPQQPIPGYQARTLPPYMVADQNRTVHAFASQFVGDPENEDELGIFYRQWTAEAGWTAPVDILLSPLNRQARVLGVYLDTHGIMHLIFFGGHEQGANIYYAWAPAVNAGKAPAWSQPLLIGPKPITPEAGGIVGDENGNLVVLYSGNLGEGNGLYAVYSGDFGVTWSEPELVYSTFLLEHQVFDFQVHLGESGTVHTVWNLVTQRGQNVAGYYAGLEHIPSRRWSTPYPLDESVGLGIAIPAVTEYRGEVFVMYNNGIGEQVAPVQWFRRSPDAGTTWTQPLRPFPNHIGRNGQTAFVIDGNDVFHVIFGQRIPGLIDTHGMWHSTWREGGWSPPIAVASAGQRPDFDPYDARAVVSQGNTILLTWRTDPGREEKGTWFSFMTVDAPEQPIEALPAAPVISILSAVADNAPADSPSDLMQPMATLAPSTESTDSLILPTEPGVGPSNPGMPLIVGIVPVLLLIALTYAARRLH